ncbi:hypothetical protein [Bradyrhizobium sp. dw_78]|uniref:hypothetical protein n=1 Tax=Bradyrhizobium sp. dw_78 TaxID=2719793 RepID=UPI001BD2E9B1|nr:hypothetical protein [Bradyrhizobium sp. dw_78]
MARRFIFIIVAGALLSAALALFCRFVFPDVLPYAVGENARMAWQRQEAFLVTTIAWLAAEVSAAFAIGLVALLWSNRSAKIRQS